MERSAETYPLVSVVVACYNHAQYITDTLDSVLADDYPNKELLILNDGSTDRSDEVVKEWIKEHGSEITVKYRARENKGVCRTSNELVDMASGRYIVMVASDDMLVPGSIRPRVELLQQHPGKMVVVSDALVIDGDNRVTMDSSIVDYNHGDKARFKDDDSILLSTLITPQISGPTVMLDRHTYDVTGRYRENLIAEDWYFYQRAAAKKLILFLDIKAGRYRVHATNTSGSNARGSARMAKTIMLTYWYNWPLMPGLKYKIIAWTELLKWTLRYIIYKTRS